LTVSKLVSGNTALRLDGASAIISAEDVGPSFRRWVVVELQPCVRRRS
jgi:hypothetical protein